MAAEWSTGYAGRDQELGRAVRALEQAGTGRFGVLTVDGEPGIGKTRLLDELAVRAEGAGWQVWRGAATEFERDLPYATYVDACAALDDEPVVAALAGTGPDRYKVHRGIREVLQRHARTRPALLLLDDLHWADPASVELTGQLIRRPPGAPLLMVLAARAGGMPVGLVDAVARLGTVATPIRLGALSPAAVAALLPGAGAHRQELLHRVSQGNPLYLRALAELSDRALAELTHDATAAEPEQALLGLLRAELAALDPPLRPVVCAAAVAGDHAPLDLIAAVAGTDEPTTSVALDQLCAQGCLVPVDPGFQFRHPLLRGAAYWTAGAGWRTGAHARAADYLRAHSAPLALLAHHVQRCARYGDERAAAELRAAATSALPAAPGSAARLLRSALQVLPERPELAAERAALTMSLARALGTSGELDESRRLLADVIARDAGQRATAVAFSSVISRLLGDLHTARALLTAELAGPVSDRRVAARLCVELAAVETLRGDPPAALSAASHAIELLTGTDDRALDSSAHALLALGHLHAGRVRDAGEHADRAAWLMDAATDPVLAPHLELVAPLCWVQLHLGRHDTAERQLDRALDVSYRTGLSHPLPYLLIVQAALRHRRGNVVGAIAAAQEAEQASVALGSPETAAMARAVLLGPTLHRDGPDAAGRVAGQLAAAGAPRSWWWADIARLSLDGFAAATGAVPPGGFAPPPDEDATDRADAVVYRLARCAVTAGTPDEARALAVRAVAVADRLGLPHQRGAAHDGYARVMLRTGDPDLALEHARAAVEEFVVAASPIEEARARELMAEAHALRGETAGRFAQLTAAKAGYARCAATWLSRQVARTEARLAAAAPRGSRTVGAPAVLLTFREREVAELASGGMTNREIAGRLQLSPKTIEAHLSRIFAKLDVHSRIELAHRLG